MQKTEGNTRKLKINLSSKSSRPTVPITRAESDLTSQSAEPGRLRCDTLQTTSTAGWFLLHGLSKKQIMPQATD